MTKIRGFELVSTYNNQDLLPKRETAHAAGYDLKVAENTMISPGEIVLVPTGVKAYMQPGEVLYLYDRSSNPRKKGLVLINSVGVIDGDYYGNPGNEGHIFAQMKNITNQPVTLEVGERMVQAVFAPFLIADGDEADGVRTGGFGSTGKQKKFEAGLLVISSRIFEKHRAYCLTNLDLKEFFQRNGIKSQSLQGQMAMSEFIMKGKDQNHS